MLTSLLLAAVVATGAGTTASPLVSGGPSIVDHYLLQYFETFPTRATQAGWHTYDSALEDLRPEQIEAWVEFNRTTSRALRKLIARTDLPYEDRLDLELLDRQVERTLFDFAERQRPRRDPLFWTGILGNATVFLLVRDDSPRPARLDHVAARVALIPRLARQAREALTPALPEELAAEICELAAGQARSSANFYRGGFTEVARQEDETRNATLQRDAAAAAVALDELAMFLEQRAATATGTPRLGDAYAELFRLATGIDHPIAEILSRAEAALAEKTQEVDAYGRTVWDSVFPDRRPPKESSQLIRQLFERVAEDRAQSVDEFIADYRNLVDLSVSFVRENDLISLPEPLTLHLDRSPDYFLGASVGGVYAAGPFAEAEAKTLLFLPTPSVTSSADEMAAFFSDFNHHFNVMITPHEIIPGHYLQLKWAARHPRKIRALFGDGIYIEGWGTFAERLMLDSGWGEPLDRLAHLKKQLENIARTIVDIRVHTRGMTREQAIELVRDEAFQKEQFATNMWRRSITSAPQLVSYFLGYEQVYGLYEDVREAHGDLFEIKSFMDGMMELGPVAVEQYRARMLPTPAPKAVAVGASDNS